MLCFIQLLQLKSVDSSSHCMTNLTFPLTLNHLTFHKNCFFSGKHKANNLQHESILIHLSSLRMSSEHMKIMARRRVFNVTVDPPTQKLFLIFPSTALLIHCNWEVTPLEFPVIGYVYISISYSSW